MRTAPRELLAHRVIGMRKGGGGGRGKEWEGGWGGGGAVGAGHY